MYHLATRVTARGNRANNNGGLRDGLQRVLRDVSREGTARRGARLRGEAGPSPRSERSRTVVPCSARAGLGEAGPANGRIRRSDERREPEGGARSVIPPGFGSLSNLRLVGSFRGCANASVVTRVSSFPGEALKPRQRRTEDHG